MPTPVSYTHLDVYKRQTLHTRNGNEHDNNYPKTRCVEAKLLSAEIDRT